MSMSIQTGPFRLSIQTFQAWKICRAPRRTRRHCDWPASQGTNGRSRTPMRMDSHWSDIGISPPCAVKVKTTRSDDQLSEWWWMFVSLDDSKILIVWVLMCSKMKGWENSEAWKIYQSEVSMLSDALKLHKVSISFLVFSFNWPGYCRN